MKIILYNKNSGSRQIIIILDKDIKEILKDLENKMFLRVKLQLVLVAVLLVACVATSSQSTRSFEPVVLARF